MPAYAEKNPLTVNLPGKNTVKPLQRSRKENKTMQTHDAYGWKRDRYGGVTL